MNRLIARFSLSVVIAVSMFSCAARPAQLTPGRFALLPASKAQEVIDQCSREAPQTDGTWEPSDSDIARIENDLPRLVGRKAGTCCILGARLRDVDSYFRQYVGVIVKGERVIYINAFPVSQFDDWPPTVARPDWSQEPFIACDGGSAFWGAIYNPTRRTFSDLSFNGIG